MKTEKEIAMEILTVTEKMMEKREEGATNDTNLLLGCIYGLLISIDREDGFIESDNPIRFINEVVFDILPLAESTNLDEHSENEEKARS